MLAPHRGPENRHMGKNSFGTGLNSEKENESVQLKFWLKFWKVYILILLDQHWFNNSLNNILRHFKVFQLNDCLAHGGCIMQILINHKPLRNTEKAMPKL